MEIDDLGIASKVLELEEALRRIKVLLDDNDRYGIYALIEFLLQKNN